jgi:hypothetical protein
MKKLIIVVFAAIITLPVLPGGALAQNKQEAPYFRGNDVSLFWMAVPSPADPLLKKFQIHGSG